MKTGINGIELIKKFEGCVLKSYKCPAGVWTIGVGHTGTVLGRKVCEGMKVSETQAIKILRTDLKKFEVSINQYVNDPLTQNQFDALVSLVFNIGAGNFKKSTLLKKLNSKDYFGASKEFAKWNKADVDGDGDLDVLNGLTRRRLEEMALFLMN